MSDEKLHLDHHDDEPPSYEQATDAESDNRHLSASDEKTLLSQREHHEEPLPAYSGPSRLPSLTFPLNLNKDGYNAFTIIVGCPTGDSTENTRWKLICGRNQEAQMIRNFADPKAQQTECHNPSAFPPSHVADVRFPGVKWSEPKIKFKTYNERHGDYADRRMECSGFFTTKYALDLPALNSSRVVWKVPDEGDMLQALKLEASDEAAKLMAAVDEKKSALPGIAREVDDPDWTPFPTQYLIEETSGRILAHYSRAAPWAKKVGTLSIPQSSGPVSEELIDNIVITCAVMVGMQYKTGLFNSLVESGIDNIAGLGKGKGRAFG